MNKRDRFENDKTYIKKKVNFLTCINFRLERCRSWQLARCLPLLQKESYMSRISLYKCNSGSNVLKSQLLIKIGKAVVSK